MSLLSVRDLSVTFHTEDGEVTAVNDLNFELLKGQTWGTWVSPARASRKRRLP